MEASDEGGVSYLESPRGNNLVEVDHGDFTLIIPYNRFNKSGGSVVAMREQSGKAMKASEGLKEAMKVMEEAAKECGRIAESMKEIIGKLKGSKDNMEETAKLIGQAKEIYLQAMRVCATVMDATKLLDPTTLKENQRVKEIERAAKLMEKTLKKAKGVTNIIKVIERTEKEMDRARKEIEQDYAVWFTYKSAGRTFLGRYVGDNLYATQYKGLIINKPRLVVAAVGGHDWHPNELKINGGISFSFPAPIYMYPKILPEDPTEYHKVSLKVYEEAMGKEFWRKAFMHAFKNAVGISSSSTCDEQLKEDYTDELFPTMIEINLATPQDLEQFDSSLWSMVSHYLPKIEEKGKGVKRNFEDCKQAAHKKTRFR